MKNIISNIIIVIGPIRSGTKKMDTKGVRGVRY